MNQETCFPGTQCQNGDQCPSSGVCLPATCTYVEPPGIPTLCPNGLPCGQNNICPTKAYCTIRDPADFVNQTPLLGTAMFVPPFYMKSYVNPADGTVVPPLGDPVNGDVCSDYCESQRNIVLCCRKPNSTALNQESCPTMTVDECDTQGVSRPLDKVIPSNLCSIMENTIAADGYGTCEIVDTFVVPNAGNVVNVNVGNVGGGGNVNVGNVGGGANGGQLEGNQAAP